MSLIERIGQKHGMSALMLTVFKQNARALSFYTDKLRCRPSPNKNCHGATERPIEEAPCAAAHL